MFEPSEYALQILKKRYFKSGEDWEGMCRRVAKFLAKDSEEEERFFKVMREGKFLPNTPCLVNANSVNPQLSACFVLPIEDSIDSIFETVKKAATIYKMGGGVGINFSSLRREGAKVQSTKGSSSGPVSFMKVFNTSTGELKSGGIRRGAAIALLNIDHPDIIKFIKCKEKDGELSNFNISVAMTDEFMRLLKEKPNDKWVCKFNNEQFYVNKDTNEPVKIPSENMLTDDTIYTVQDVWNLIVKKAWLNGEPGLIFIDEIQRKNGKDIVCVNPCVTGDTLVYVADGRGLVAINELAKIGKDVNVVCINDTQQLVVRKMRNPRITGYKQHIKKITFHDGTYITVTENHKLLTVKNEYIKAGDISLGTRLKIASKKIDNLGYGQILFNRKPVYEHRLFKLGHSRKTPDICVHHKNRNRSDNSINNLQVMLEKYHKDMHMFGDENPMRRAAYEWSEEKWDSYKKNMSKSVGGENNGRWLGINDEELMQYMVQYVENLGFRPSKKQWHKFAKKNGLPQEITNCRKYKNITEMLIIAAKKAKIINVIVDPRMQKSIINLHKQGYKTKIVNGMVNVLRVCELCDKAFWVDQGRREQCCCSNSCGNLLAQKKGKFDKARDAMRKTYQIKKEKTKEQQIEMYNELQACLLREPLYKEFKKKCKENDIPSRVGKHSPFLTYTELKEAANDKNHAVIAIEDIGQQTVYNGTVDDFHNFFIASPDSARNKFKLFNNLQCGELPLSGHSACVLGSIDVSKYINFGNANPLDKEVLERDIKICVDFLNRVIDKGKMPLQEITEKVQQERKIGLGIMGLADVFIMLKTRYGSLNSLKIAERIMGFVTSTARKYSEQQGYNNKELTCIAPCGSISLLANCSSGCEPNFAWETTYNRQDFGKTTVVHKLAKPYLDQKEKLPDYFVTANDITPEEHVRMQAILQKHVDSSISKTVGMPNSATKEDVDKAYRLAHELKCKGITVYRDGCREHQVISSKEKIQKKETPQSKKQIKNRPKILFGATYQINTPSGRAYITINEAEGKVREVFVNVSKSGSQVGEFTASLGRLISNSLQYDVPIETIIDHLKDQKSDPVWEQGRLIKSVSDGISFVIQHFRDTFEGFSESLPDDINMQKEEKKFENGDSKEKKLLGEPCPECGELLTMGSGCCLCLSCGYSKCG